MDVSQIKSRNIKFELKHPGSAKGLGIHIELRPNDSDEVKVVRDAYIEMVQQKARRGEDMSVEETAEESGKITLAAIANIKFEGKANWNGQTEFSEKLAQEMIEAKWVRKQIDKKSAAEAAFFAD